MNSIESVDKINVEDLIKDFKVLNVDVFTSYLKEIWRDLAQRSDDKSKGVNKITFIQYYELPGIIAERLFSVFDKNKNDYIDVYEFVDGMTTLFTESYDKLHKFIFNFYDFDKDGLISREDIRVVLSYIPLNVDKYSSLKLKYEKEEFKDRVESQNELDKLLSQCFVNEDVVDIKKFKYIVENVCSDIFLYILIFILEKKPFSKMTLKEYDRKNALKIITRTPDINRMIASPNLNSKFSPSITISKSPSMTKKRMSIGFNTGFNNAKADESKNLLLRFAGKPSNVSVKKVSDADIDEDVTVRQVPIIRKKNVFRDIESLSKQTSFSVTTNNDNLDLTRNAKSEIKKEYTDLPIEPAIKQSFNDLEEDDDDDVDEIKMQGSLYKITQTKKLKKLWFKLYHKDLYYYKTKDDDTHKGMHNLSGVHLKEEAPIQYQGYTLLCFSVVYPKKIRYYYVDNEKEYREWVKAIRRATGYANLTDLYEVKDKLGNGKFGLVRLGIHIETGRRVAVKIMSKKDMTTQDLELVKTEIEVLKICQHPNIIRIYDVFENVEYIYIIMEFCGGGDLFSYIEKRGFKLTEVRTAQLIHKLSTAIYYLHSYGICHRDLKPENILMTDNSEEADIRLVDFGLSKIIGPNEFCNEPFGTLSYVAPEVLLEKPYDKSVDLWSIGVITYLLLCGCLPFDDEHSEREIARQTIHDPVPYPSSIWKKLSSDAKLFVDSLLQKDPSKRLSIKEVLEHPWIQKYNKSHLPEMRRKSKCEASAFKIYVTSTEDNINNS